MTIFSDNNSQIRTNFIGARNEFHELDMFLNSKECNTKILGKKRNIRKIQYRMTPDTCHILIDYDRMR